MLAQRQVPAAVTVLKAGGAVVDTPGQLRLLAAHVRARRREGRAVVVVHGGGALVSELHERLAVPFTKRAGLRVTSEEGMRLTAMVLRGEVNAAIVASFVGGELDAIGLSGVDLGLMRSAFLNRAHLGRVGGPPRVAAARLRELLARGMVPVLAPVCLGPDEGLLNVNADTAAHSVAVALEAEVLEFVCDVPGVLDGEGAVVRRLDPPRTQALLAAERVHGGMIPKLQAALAALEAGVRCVRIGSLESLAGGAATELVAA